MGLSTFEPESYPIQFKANRKDHEFNVRGLTLIDLSYLVGEHIVDIDAALELYKSSKDTMFSRASIDALILMLCRDAPGLVAEVISVAADERDLKAQYAKLPFSVSALALAEILRMTLEEQGGLKNLSATLVNLLRDVLPERLKDVLGSPKAT